MPLNFSLSKKGGSKSSKKPSATRKSSDIPVSAPIKASSLHKDLVGFVEVSKNDWINLPIGTLIRYYRIDGTFIPGGFLIKTWYNDEDKVNYLSLEHEKIIGSNNAHSISFSRIARLFKHPTVNKQPSVNVSTISSTPDIPSQQLPSDMDGKLQMMLNYIRKQEFKCNNMETTITGLVERVKYLETKLTNIQTNACMLSDVVNNINTTLCKK